MHRTNRSRLEPLANSWLTKTYQSETTISLGLVEILFPEYDYHKTLSFFDLAMLFCLPTRPIHRLSAQLNSVIFQFVSFWSPTSMFDKLSLAHPHSNFTYQTNLPISPLFCRTPDPTTLYLVGISPAHDTHKTFSLMT